MKRTLSLFLAMAVSMVVMAGCNGNSDAEPFTAKNYTAGSAEVKEISIDVRDRAVEVSVSEDDKIHIDYFENSKEFYDISVSGNVLTMNAATDKEWKDYVGTNAPAKNRKISIKVPNELLNALKISTTNENISLEALTIGADVVLSNNNGNITFDSLNAGSVVTLTAKNSDINGSIVGGYDDYAITCEIKKGDSNLPTEKTDGAKTLTVSANNGDVNIEFNK